MATATEVKPARAVTTSFYLDDETRTKLDRMAGATGASKSNIMRGLINGADEEGQRRICELVSELNQLVGGT